MPLAELVALFELLGLSEGLIRNANAHEQAVKQLRARANELTEEVVTVTQQVQTGLPCWGSELISGQDREEQRQKLDELKGFLESLQAFNTPGKLKNFTRTITEIQAQKANLDLVKQVEELNDLVQELTPMTGYLATATAVLPPQDPWRDQMESTRGSWRAKLLDPALRGRPDFRQIINRALQKAKDDYKTTYLNLHKKARLGINEDEKKKELLKDPRLDQLKKLAAGISLLPHASLTELQTRLSKLTPCFTLVKDDLDASPICPHCNFRPQEENARSQRAGGSPTDRRPARHDAGELAQDPGRQPLRPHGQEEHQPLAVRPEGGRRGLPEVQAAPREDRRRSGPGDSDGLVRPDRHERYPRRSARLPVRRRRPLHGRAASHPV